MKIKNFPRLFLSLLLISSLLLLLDRGGKLNFFHQAFSRLTREKRTASLIREEEKDIGEKEKKIASLEAKVSQLEEENKRARRLLGADLSPQLKFVPAHILGINQDQCQIDLGSVAGAEAGNWLVSENILIGRIIQANSFSSEAILVQSRDFQIAVGLWREDQLVGKGILHGGVNLMVEEILPEEEVKPGDLVIGLENQAQFVIGRVSQVSLDESKVFRRAKVDWLAGPRQLVTVFLVKQ